MRPIDFDFTLKIQFLNVFWAQVTQNRPKSSKNHQKIAFFNKTHMSNRLQRENVLSFPLGIRIPMVENFKNKENLKNKVENVIKVAEN